MIRLTSCLRGLATIMRTIDIRFNSVDEALYRASHEPQLMRQMAVASVILMISSLGFFRLELQWDTEDPRMLCQFMGLLGNAMWLSQLGFVLLRLWKGWFQHVVVEYVAICVCGYFLIWICLRYEWYALRAYGKQPQDFPWELRSPPDPETKLVLSLGMAMIGVCLWMPIRSHMSWMLIALAIVVFCFAALLGSPVDYPSSENAFNLLILCLLTHWGAYRQDRQVREKWLAEHQVEAQRDLLQTQEQAAYRMLDHLCDSWLHITPDSTIIQQSSRMSAMLFLTGQQQLQGSTLREHLASEEDQCRFREAVQQISMDVINTETMSLHLRDARGYEFQVHAYLSCFHATIGEPRILIGFTEASEREHDPVAEPPPRPSLSDRSGTTKSSSSSQADWESLPISGLDELAVTFCDDDDLTLVSITPAFTAMCGPCANEQSFAKWVGKDSKFNGWVQEAGNAFRHLKYHDLVLNTAAIQSVGKQFVIASCSVQSIGLLTSPEGEASDTLCIRIAFEGIKVRKAKREKEHRRFFPPVSKVVVSL